MSASAATPAFTVPGKLVVGKTSQAEEPVMLEFTAHNQSGSATSPFVFSYVVSSNRTVDQIVCTDSPQGSIVGGDTVSDTCPAISLPAHKGFTTAIVVDVQTDDPPLHLTVEGCAGQSVQDHAFCATKDVPLND